MSLILTLLFSLRIEVVQQMRARKKEDFALAFSPLIAEACEVAYKQSPADIQNKTRRVIDVWQQRSIFDAQTIQAIKSRLDGKKIALNASCYSLLQQDTSKLMPDMKC